MNLQLKKKLVSLMICLGLLVNGPLPVFATSGSNSETSIASTYASTSFSMELKPATGQVGKIVNMGFNPTVTVTATGNPNMEYRVSVVNPVGITGVVGYVRGDGSTISKNLWMSIGGDYHVWVENWSGTTNAKSAYFNFSVTW